MNPIISIALLYGFMALGTINILYFSFKEKIDYSGRLFLCAEIFVFPTVAFLILVNLDPIYKQPLIYFMGNASYISSEISVAFSIYALTHQVSIRKYLLTLAGGLAFCTFQEYMRILNPAFPLLTFPIAYFFLTSSTYILCSRIVDAELKNNPFLKWFQFLEMGLASVAILRIVVFFSGTALSPVGSNASTVTLITTYMVLNLFRFVSYQSLRMTWVPQAENENFLNKSLAQSFRENNQLRHGLMNSNRLLGVSALASSLAHQLSQPLTGAALETESIKRDLSKGGQQDKAAASLSKISQQLGKLSDLVSNLRKLFGANDQQFQYFELAPVCDEILNLLEPMTVERKIVVQRDYRFDPTVIGDPIQIQQVIINLLNNAIEAISLAPESRKCITVRIDQDANFAVIAIEDSGPGIDKHLLPTIFDLYKTNKQNGMGIGLWLSKTIVTKHNGKITATNKADGGALFEVRIPMARM